MPKLRCLFDVLRSVLGLPRDCVCSFFVYGGFVEALSRFLFGSYGFLLTLSLDTRRILIGVLEFSGVWKGLCRGCFFILITPP